MTDDHTQVDRNPQTDYETEQSALELESAVRLLNRAVGQTGGLAGPATVYAVLDAVHAAAATGCRTRPVLHRPATPPPNPPPRPRAGEPSHERDSPRTEGLGRDGSAAPGRGREREADEPGRASCSPHHGQR